MPAGQETYQGAQTQLNISGSITVKTGTGRVAKICVTTAGSAAGTVNDCASTGAAAASNLIAAIPNAVGVIDLQMPFYAGLTIIPGSGQVLSLSYS